ncbi:MAG: SBBP repeat-containing protein [Bacteroidetes bacterium]|nr:SBBP repeat-containing protein [Bacteroidota bacterium]
MMFDKIIFKPCLIFLIVSVLGLSGLNAQEGWLQNFGGKSQEEGSAIAVDKKGNVYMTGYITNKVYFGNDSIEASGWNDFFLAKYDRDGKVLWAKRCGGSFWDWGTSIAIDKNDDVIVTGVFSKEARFDEDSLTSRGDLDIFIAKYSPEGELKWLRQAGGPTSDQSSSLQVDDDGNVYVSGTFSTTIQIENKKFTSAGREDIFIFKLDKEGALLWFNSFGGKFSDHCMDAHLDGDRNLLLTGYFTEEVMFGAEMAKSYGWMDIFLIKINRDGKLLWFNIAGSVEDDIGTAVITDKNGNVYLTGEFNEECQFGNQRFETAYRHSAFLARYSPAGKLDWVKQFGGKSSFSSVDLAIDPSQNIFIAGVYKGTCSFGDLTSLKAKKFDIYIAKLDKEYNWAWLKTLNGKRIDLSFGLAADKNGCVYLTGRTNKNLAIKFSASVLTTQARKKSDAFLLKLCD